MAKILIIEDASYLRTMYKKLIDLIGGHEVIEAVNGREGIEKICSDEPDLVLADLSMPEMDGMELLTVLRDTNVDAKVIIVSSNTDEITADRCFNLGVSAFLNKPLKKDDLREAIEKVLSKKKED